MPSIPASRASVGEALHLIGRRAVDSGGGEVALVEAGQHGDPDDLGPARRGGLGRAAIISRRRRRGR